MTERRNIKGLGEIALRVNDPTTTTVGHIAFEIDLADFESEKQRLEQLGVAVGTAEHAWVHWRSLYVTDPEGHTVELVCCDPSVTDG